MKKEYDFSKAKRAKDAPALAKIQADLAGKARVTLYLDNLVIAQFKARATLQGEGYQTLINRTLREALNAQGLTEETIRRVVREELAAA
jgi:uncharacterized protein (DUF4415 family)